MGFKELICILSRQGCCTEAGARPLGLKKLHSDTRNDIIVLLPIIGSNAIFYGDNTYGNNESAFR